MLDTRLLYGYNCFSDRHAGRSAGGHRAAARDTGLSQADVVRQKRQGGPSEDSEAISSRAQT